jgi:hypothetical protein
MELHVLNMSPRCAYKWKKLQSEFNLTNVQQNRTMRSAINFKSYIHTHSPEHFQSAALHFQTAFHRPSWKLKSIKNPRDRLHTRFSCEPETAFSNLLYCKISKLSQLDSLKHFSLSESVKGLLGRG